MITQMFNYSRCRWRLQNVKCSAVFPEIIYHMYLICCNVSSEDKVLVKKQNARKFLRSQRRKSRLHWFTGVQNTTTKEISRQNWCIFTQYFMYYTWASMSNLESFEPAHTNGILWFQWHPVWSIAVSNHIFACCLSKDRWCESVINPFLLRKPA